MLEVKKSGKTEFGYWCMGVLEYQGLIIKDLFSVNKSLETNTKYEVKNIVISRSRNGEIRIKLEI